MKNKLFIVLVFFFPFFAFSQEKQEKTQPSYSTLDKILQIDKTPIRSSLKLPIFTLGTGVVSYHGDIQNDEPSNFSVGCNAIHFEMMQKIASSSFKFGIRYLRSEIRGTEYYSDIQTQYNFKTEINSFGAFLRYDLATKSQRRRIVTPYATAGISILQRPEARGDWKVNGQTLYLWSDGTFRDIAETQYNASKSSILYRDYDYETSLQVENQDQRDYYCPIIASVPIEIGIRYNISKGIKLNLGYQYHFSMTNTMDNITYKGKKRSKVSKWPDGFSYAYVSLTADISQMPKKSRFSAYYNDSYYVGWDADNDGIDETEDDCPYTPEGVDVFASGCPLDDDNDGVPNYLDKEANTNAFFHDKDGKGMTEDELLAIINQGEKLSQSDLYTYYPELLNGNTSVHSFYKRIPKKFKICDIDKNDFIDLNELLLTINSFFDSGKNSGPGTNLTSKDLSELIEFFFLQ